MKPAATEFAPFYKGYVDQVQDENLNQALKDSLKRGLRFFASFPKNKREYRYASGKWTPKELIVHLTDAERIFAYRALRISRGDTTPLSGFDHDSYVPASQANSRKWKDVLKEYKSVRKATISLYRSMDDEMLLRMGVSNDSEISVRALGYIICGHQRHHISVLKEKYIG